MVTTFYLKDWGAEQEISALKATHKTLSWMRNIPMQSEISDYTVSLKVLIDLAFKTQFLNNVEPPWTYQIFLITSLPYFEGAARERLRRKGV